MIGETGDQLGIVPTNQAMKLAGEKGLDLVKISPNAVPPVCKLMDYGKFRFEQSKKEKEARKNQKVVELKEVWLSMTIDDNDMQVKAKHAKRFLGEGDKVKVSIRMRGRQQAHASLGIKVMESFFEIVKDVCAIELPPKTEGRSILMILVPNKA